MSSFCKCKSYSHFFSKNVSVYAIFIDQSFNDTLSNNIVSLGQLDPGILNLSQALLSHVAYFFVISRALELYFCLSLTHNLAISGINGSSGLGSVSNVSIDSKTEIKT